MHTNWTPQLDPDKPKYRALYDELVDGIKAGTLSSDAKLPPIRELAYQLQITPATVVRAYQMATDKGYLEARRGDGTYVRETQEHYNPKEFPLLKENVVSNVDGYNLFSRSIPDFGQSALFNQIVYEISSQNAFQSHIYVPASARDALKQKTCQWLKRDGLKVNPQDIVLTQGASNACAVALTAIRRGDAQLQGMIEPVTYTGFVEKSLLSVCKFHVLEIDEGGIIPQSLKMAAANGKTDFLVTSSICSNPHSVTLSEDRMEEIAAIARLYDFQIIDDILYSHLCVNRSKSLRDFAPERVWAATSLAKLGYPALNLGVLLPPKSEIARAEEALDWIDIHTNQMQYPIVMALLDHPEFYRLIELLREEIRVRQEIARRVFKGHKFQMADGAPFLWLYIPEGLAVSRFMNALLRRKVRGASSDIFSLQKKTTNAIRLTLGGEHNREELEEALLLVKDALENEEYERVD